MRGDSYLQVGSLDRQKSASRTIQSRRISPGEIGPHRTIVRHEQRISLECCIACDVAHADRRMFRRMHDARLRLGDAERLPILKQPVKQ